MYEYIEEELDVSDIILAFDASDVGTTEDITVDAGDVIVVLFEQASDFDLSAIWAEQYGLEAVVTWTPGMNDEGRYEAGIGI